MKLILNSFLYFFHLVVFSQTSEKLISYDEFTKDITIIDTLVYKSFHKSKELKSIRTVEKQKIIIRGKTIFAEQYLMEVFYNKNGLKKSEHFYEDWLFLRDIHYDRKGYKKIETIYDNSKTENTTIWIGNKHYQGGPSDSYQILKFKKGKLIQFESFKEKKKDGVWLYYNFNNEIIKKVTWKMGEKLKTENQ